MSLDITNFDISEYVPYMEREIWSPRFPRWKRYEVTTPRLPTKADSESKNRWVDKYRPRVLHTYQGRDNETTRKGFQNLIDIFEGHSKFPSVVVIQGPPGTGKSSFANSLAWGLCSGADVDGDTHTMNRWFLKANCKGLDSRELDNLWTKINNHVMAADDQDVKCSFRLILLDDFGFVSTPNQMNFKNVFENTANKARYILVTSNVNKFASFVESRLNATQIYTTNHVAEYHCLTIILNILRKNKVGYDIDGVKQLFRSNIKLNLSKMIDDMQEIFITRHYLSKENVITFMQKKYNMKPKRAVLEAWAAITPLQRCPACTLYPPCKHITEVDLASTAADIKSKLPIYKGGMICPGFARFGRCSQFLSTGHCSLSHPKKMHSLRKIPLRCGQCTLPWPCNHCEYTKVRTQILRMLDDLTGRLDRLRRILQPNPPGNLVGPLKKYFPDWKEELKENIHTENMDYWREHLKECYKWIDETTSHIHDVYRIKEKETRLMYRQVLEADMLRDPSEFPSLKKSDLDLLDDVDDEVLEASIEASESNADSNTIESLDNTQSIASVSITSGNLR